MDILALLKQQTEDRGGYPIVSHLRCREIAAQVSLGVREVEIAALEGGLCPSRYERNMGTIGPAGQIKLLHSRIAVLGCGGLGGYIIEMLARSGVGALTLVDGDAFSDSNLNRQLLCTEDNNGKNKAIAGVQRVASINSAIEARACAEYFRDENGDELLRGCDLVLDALDNNKSRLSALRACAKMEIPFVHGAIAGFWGQVGVFYPGDTTPWTDSEALPDKGVELQTGNPSFTPAFIAALEVAEAIKIITNAGKPLRHQLLWFDLEQEEMQKIRLA